MAKLKLVILFALVLQVKTAEVFVFQQPIYTLTETSGTTVTVMISRTGSSAQSQTTISTDCPSPFQATATYTADYTVSATTITFPSMDYEQPVSITIVDDSDDEYREFFCLTITTRPGIGEYTTRVYIPGNDYCVTTDSPVATSVNSINTVHGAPPAAPSAVTYVGPWFVGDSGVPDTINVEIKPNSAGAAEVINIFLRTNVDQSVAGNYYAILLDIDSTLATPYTTNSVAAQDSIVAKDASTFVGILNDNSVSNVDVVAPAGDTFTLKYTESSGTITLTDTSNNMPYTADDNATPLDVSHLFVSSGNNDYASWKICGLLPRKLPIAGAYDSGHETGRSADKAIDNNKSPQILSGGCFISSASKSDPWLQIDLGREFDVKLILIWPSENRAGTSDPNWLDNAEVYVGSCPPDTIASITSNHQCSADIGNLAGTESVVEVKCSGTNNYGRYVYIHKDTTTAQQIALCEVEVYGDEIPIGNEATVSFSASTFQTINDESASAVTISATRNGTALTCTTADFYTDTVTIPTGNTDDFTSVSSSNPTQLKWIATDTSSTTKPVTVTVKNDDICESTETFNVYLTNVNGGILGSQTSSTVSIIDDDSVTYALSSASFSVVEGSSRNIGVTRTGTGTNQVGSAGLTFTDVTAQSGDYASADATVNFTATSGSPEYYTMNTVDDEAYEGDETFTVNLGDVLPSPCSNKGTQQTATFTITDNDSSFKWDVTGNTGAITIPEGTATTTLSISRVGTAQSKTINVIGPLSSSDISLSSSSVTFDINDPSQSIIATVVDDSIVENDESFTLTLEDPKYTTGDRNLVVPYILTVTIQDNDAEYTWKQSQYTTTEGSGTVQVCMLRSGDTTTTKTIQISTAVIGATSGVDFTPLTQITFIGNNEACANVVITTDDEVESTESFTLTIVTGQQDVAIGSINTAQVSITDDDYEVKWESSSYSFSETSPTNAVTITKTGTGSPTITITSQQETATQSVDFAPVSTSVTISGSSVQIPITIYNDGSDEPSETFTLTLSGSGIASLVTRITILDDDPTPTTPPPEQGLSGPAIAGIIVGAIVGGILIIIVIGTTCYCLSAGAPGPEDAIPAGAARSGFAPAPVNAPATQGYTLSNLQYPGLKIGNGFNSVVGNGFNSTVGNGFNSTVGNGFNSAFGNGYLDQGFGGFGQPALGFA